MTLTPILHPAAKFFPTPKNPLTGEFDLVCEEPLGDIARAVALRNQVLRSPPSPELASVVEEIVRFAGIAALGIPLDGASDCMHTRQTYQDRDGVERQEAPGIRVVCIEDLKTISQINDHVTASKIYPGYAQTDAQVVNDPQMLIYGKRYLDKFKDATHTRLNKVYVQKHGQKIAEIRGGLVSRQQVEDAWGELVNRVVFEMIETARAEKIEDVRPAVGSSCDAYYHLEGCGATGCGVGCIPGKIKTTSDEVYCSACKGKGRNVKGCGYKGTINCPLPASVSVPLISMSLDSKQSTGGSLPMSLFDQYSSFDNVSSTVPTLPAPSPVLDDDDYELEVENETAKIEASLGMPPSPPTPPVPPAAVTVPVVPTTVLVSPKAPSPLGDKIQVATCMIGEEYMVDAEDGHAPYRMKLIEVSSGKFKFRDAVGAMVNLDVKDKVWKPGEAAAPTPPMPKPPTTAAVQPPDAPKVRWVDQAAPLSGHAIVEITDPALHELAVEHKRVAEEEQAKKDAAEAAANPQMATRGGNCTGFRSEGDFRRAAERGRQARSSARSVAR